MRDSLRTILPENLSGEAASCLVTFLYDLALTIESIYLGEILKYSRSIEEEHPDWTEPPF